jgi:hypothetical protein
VREGRRIAIERQPRRAFAKSAELLRVAEARKDEVRPVNSVHREQQEHSEVRETQGNLHAPSLASSPAAIVIDL